MSKHKYTTVVCIAIIIAMLTVTVALMLCSGSGLITVAHAQPQYADKLFSTDKVHKIDIVVEDSDWTNMLANAQAEEYIQCSVVIDGETVSGVGIRPKGNSSLSMISRSDSDRYSFKIEFDHYSNDISYYGLDKLALNNIAQDNTYMKDYICYQMMNEMGAYAPLSSFIWVTVNGEDWGLYLAVEGVEEAFARRVYGNNYGEIYKPDTMDMNQGNKADHTADQDSQMQDFDGKDGQVPQMPDMSSTDGQFPQMPGFGDRPGQASDSDSGQDADTSNQSTQFPGFGGFGNNGDQMPQMPGFGGKVAGMPQEGGGFGWSSSNATSLIYTDDDPDSYSAIFDNAVFNPSKADKEQLIESLKQLNAGENLEDVLDIDEVIRYFAVHNFVLNSDSYTGSLTHNYYLAENAGKLSMIAWDYNLAFGGMGDAGGRMSMRKDATGTSQTQTIDIATTLVNYPIDSPMLSGTIDSKPMISWIFANEEHLAEYHAVLAEFMEYFSSGKFAEMYDNAIALITPYVEKDPTAFCTYEEFLKGSSALREFCLLRAESIQGQLDGTIASTSEEQSSTNNAGFIDASSIDIESMGSNEMGFGRARAGQFPMQGDRLDNRRNSSDSSPAQGSPTP